MARRPRNIRQHLAVDAFAAEFERRGLDPLTAYWLAGIRGLRPAR
jgi:hypothetical protein